LVIKNTLEFDPEILKRYVNFMNNPDERTAVDQFGKGDKYFGICTLMATMPGLPMFGHGQVEGFTEKYGMEFRRAYWDEYPDNYLVERHEREIFPLMHRRYLFAEVRDFLLYDFFSTEGSVNEDVFAFSNRAGDERALVIYHNRFAEARGWIRDSAAYSVKTGVGEERRLVRRSLGEGLGLHRDGNFFTIFRDQASGLEYIRNSQDLHQDGMFIELGAYKYHVFVDFREVEDNDWHQYAQLTTYLNGRGVPSIADAIKEIFLQPIHDPFRALVGAELFRNLITDRHTGWEELLNPELMNEVEQKSIHLISEINNFVQAGRNKEEIKSLAKNIQGEIEAIDQITRLELKSFGVTSKSTREVISSFVTGLAEGEEVRRVFNGVLIGWTITHALGRIVSDDDYPARSRSWLDEFLFGKILANALVSFGLDEPSAWKVIGMVKILTNNQDWSDLLGKGDRVDYQIISLWLKDGEIQRYLRVNRYQGILWFNHEAYTMLIRWMAVTALIRIIADTEASQTSKSKKLSELSAFITRLESAELKSEYQVEKLLEQVRD